MTDHKTDAASITVHMGSYLMGLRDGAADPGKARRSLEANGPLVDEPGFAEASAEAKRKLDAAAAHLAARQPGMSSDNVLLEAMRVFAREVGAAAPEEVSPCVRERWERGMRAVIAFLSPLGTSALAGLAVTQPAAAPDAGGWLPIKSAPKDGTKIDVWAIRPKLAHGDRFPRRITELHWLAEEELPHGGCWVDQYMNVIDWLNEPRREYDIIITHYRPLPPPPGASAPPVAPAPGAGDAAIRDVLAERRRQVEEGWTPEHDDIHRGGQMALAASCYALRSREGCDPANGNAPAKWPWGRAMWKLDSPRRMLVKAGALILAEIERLDRAALRDGSGGK